MLIGVAEEDRIDSELWDAAYSLKPGTPSIELRKAMRWVPLEPEEEEDV